MIPAPFLCLVLDSVPRPFLCVLGLGAELHGGGSLGPAWTWAENQHVAPVEGLVLHGGVRPSSLQPQPSLVQPNSVTEGAALAALATEQGLSRTGLTLSPWISLTGINTTRAALCPSDTNVLRGRFHYYSGMVRPTDQETTTLKREFFIFTDPKRRGQVTPCRATW